MRGVARLLLQTARLLRCRGADTEPHPPRSRRGTLPHELQSAQAQATQTNPMHEFCGQGSIFCFRRALPNSACWPTREHVVGPANPHG